MVNPLVIENSVVVSCDKEYSGALVVPKGVIEIGQYAFKGCNKITSIIIPDGVRVIGNSAFSGCSSLESLEVPDSVCKIQGAILGPWGGNLKKPVFNAKIFFRLPFNYQGEYKIPNGIEIIAPSAFFRCDALTSIIMPDSVIEIGCESGLGFAFCRCLGLSSISIPNSVRRIGNSAFSKCSNLKFVEMSNGVEEIGKFVFNQCEQISNPVCSKHIFIKLPKSHEGSYVIPYGIEKIEDGAFSNCKNLTSVEIPNSVVKIGNGAFENCSSLTTIEIPNSVIEIGCGAFDGCSSLTAIYIPNGFKDLYCGIFGKCNSLRLIYVSQSVEFIHRDNIKDKGPKLKFVVDKNNKDYCDVNGTLYSKDMWWLYHFYGGKTDYFSVPKSVSLIMEYAFEWSKINVVEIGESVEEIMEGAFWDSRINKILLSHNIKKIGKQAFVKCTVKELHMRHERPEQINVAEDAFEQCAEKCTLYVPVGTGYAYRHHPVFGKFKDVIIEQ